jgi:hypothetical protein
MQGSDNEFIYGSKEFERILEYGWYLNENRTKIGKPQNRRRIIK